MTALKLCEASLLTLEQELEAAEIELTAAQGLVNSIRIELAGAQNHYTVLVEQTEQRKFVKSTKRQRSELNKLRNRCRQLDISFSGTHTPKAANEANDLIHLLTSLIRDEEKSREDVIAKVTSLAKVA